MNLYISGIPDVLNIQKNMNITKTLSIMEYDPKHIYYSLSKSINTWIKVSDHEMYVDETSPSLFTIKQIVDFGLSLQSDDNILIHCHAGVSRSTAAGIIIAYLHTQDINKACEIILSIRPDCAPNRLIAKLADVYLQTENNIIFNEVNKITSKRYINLSNDKR